MPRLPIRRGKLWTIESENYEIVRWVVLVILGGSMEGFVIISYVEFFSYLGHLQTPIELAVITIIVELIVGGVFLFLSPVMLSFALSRLTPSRQLVAPFYMDVVSGFYLLNYILITYKLTSITVLAAYLTVLYVALGGLSQDAIATTIMGRGVLREDIIARTIMFETDFDSVTKTLSRPFYSRRLGISRNSFESKRGVIFPDRERRSTSHNVAIEVCKPAEGDDRNQTIVNLCVWNRGRYNFYRDDNLEEFFRDRLVYLEDIFAEPRPEENRHPVKSVEQGIRDTATLVDSILDEAGGIVVHTERISAIGWLQIVALIVVIGIAFGLLVVGGTEPTIAGVSSIILIALYLIFQLPPRFGRGGQKHI